MGGLRAFPPSCPGAGQRNPRPGPTGASVGLVSDLLGSGRSQRLPQVGGLGASPSHPGQSERVEGAFYQGHRLLFTIAVSRERAAADGSVSRLDILHQNLRRLVLCWGRDSSCLGNGV